MGLIKGLLEQGYRVLAIAPPDEMVVQIEAVGCTFIPLKQLNRKGTNPVQDLRLINNLRDIYRREQVDLALHYTIKPVIYGTIAARLAGVRCLNTLTGLGYAFLSNGLVNRLVKRLYRFSLRYADQVWFQNRDDLAVFINAGLVDANKAAIVNGSGINTNYFQPQGVVTDDPDFHFLFIGRLLVDKGIREYIEAARTLLRQGYPISFHIIGQLDDGNPAAISAKELQSWLAEPGIIYHGSQSDVRSYIAKSDALVLPSYREGLPRVMLEGLAMAKPLIATDVPGCRETVVPNENGYLVPVKSSKHLAAAMQKMCNLELTDLKRMGAYGRQMALDRFDEQHITQQYLTEIFSLLKD